MLTSLKGPIDTDACARLAPAVVERVDALALPLADDSVDLVFGSPPYALKGRRYGEGLKRWQPREWSAWMLDVTREACRVSRGWVVWVVNGPYRGRYFPAVERLIVALDDAGLRLERPCIWHKNAPPNRRDWFGNDWEFVVAVLAGERYFDPAPVAKPPKYRTGGRFRQRGENGRRRLGSEYPQRELAHPRDVVRATVGGGHMGSSLACENEAPMPESLAEHFVATCCPPGGTVCDPFSGSGTTAAVALRLFRRAIAFDVRESQVQLTRQRLEGRSGR